MTYPIICIICYVAVALVKKTALRNEWLPILSCGIGGALALIAALAFPQLMPEASLLATTIGGALSGLAATGGDQVLKQAVRLICERHEIAPEKLDPIVDAAEKLLGEETSNE